MKAPEANRTSFGIVYGDIPIELLCDHVFFQEGPGLRKWQWTDSGMEVINGRNILVDGTIDLSNTSRCISMDEFESRYSHFAVEDGDIVVTSSGTIGKVGRIKRKHLPIMMNTSVIRFHPLPFSGLDAGYLYAFLRSELFQHQAHSFAIGAAQPNFGPVHLKQMRMPLPPLPTQRKIAVILSAYDDLIENNLRRIQILEEMAQNLFREWFVNFRFPGHRQARFVDSALGRIPEGWEAVSLGAYCELVLGQSPKSQFYNEDGEGLPFHQGVTGFGDRFPTDKVFCTVLKRVAEAGDILFSVRAPVGRINIALHKVVVGRGVSAIRARDGHQHFLLHQLKELFREEDSMGNGAIFKAVTKADLIGIQLIQPAQPTLVEFDRIAEDLGAQIRVLTQKNNTLRRTRDLLLPKLISGVVDVSELDISVPQEADA